MHTIINSVTDRENNLEIITTNIIKQLGIPANLKGYRYLRYALMLCAENSEMITSATKLLYPAIAAKFNTTPLCISSAISRAIGLVWTEENEELLCLYFGKSILKRQRKPTNVEFIANISDMLRLRIKKQS